MRFSIGVFSVIGRLKKCFSRFDGFIVVWSRDFGRFDDVLVVWSWAMVVSKSALVVWSLESYIFALGNRLKRKTTV